MSTVKNETTYSTAFWRGIVRCQSDLGAGFELERVSIDGLTGVPIVHIRVKCQGCGAPIGLGLFGRHVERNEVKLKSKCTGCITQ